MVSVEAYCQKLEIAQVLIRNPPPNACSDIAESYKIAELVDTHDLSQLVAQIDTGNNVCLQGILLQLKVMRAFFGELRPDDTESGIVSSTTNAFDFMLNTWYEEAPSEDAASDEDINSFTSDDGQEVEEKEIDEASALKAVEMAARAPARNRAVAIALAMKESRGEALEEGAKHLIRHYRWLSQQDTIEIIHENEEHLVVQSLLACLPLRECAVLDALAAAVASPLGSGFVERCAALGGVRPVVDALRHTIKIQSAQIAGLSVLGHSRLLDQEVTRLSAVDAMVAALAALKIHSRSAKLVGLAAIAIANLAHRDSSAANTLIQADGCRLIVDSVLALSGPNTQVQTAHAAACWALGTLASAGRKIHTDGRLLTLATEVQDGNAEHLFHEVLARFPEQSAAARNAIFARDQLVSAISESSADKNNDTVLRRWLGFVATAARDRLLPAVIRRGRQLFPAGHFIDLSSDLDTAPKDDRPAQEKRISSDSIYLSRENKVDETLSSQRIVIPPSASASSGNYKVAPR